MEWLQEANRSMPAGSARPGSGGDVAPRVAGRGAAPAAAAARALGGRRGALLQSHQGHDQGLLRRRATPCPHGPARSLRRRGVPCMPPGALQGVRASAPCLPRLAGAGDGRGGGRQIRRCNRAAACTSRAWAARRAACHGGHSRRTRGTAAAERRCPGARGARGRPGCAIGAADRQCRAPCDTPASTAPACDGGAASHAARPQVGRPGNVGACAGVPVVMGEYWVPTERGLQQRARAGGLVRPVLRGREQVKVRAKPDSCAMSV